MWRRRWNEGVIKSRKGRLSGLSLARGAIQFSHCSLTFLTKFTSEPCWTDADKLIELGFWWIRMNCTHSAILTWWSSLAGLVRLIAYAYTEILLKQRKEKSFNSKMWGMWGYRNWPYSAEFKSMRTALYGQLSQTRVLEFCLYSWTNSTDGWTAGFASHCQGN